MTLNPLLTSSYLQYKLDTDNVASWLARTAKKCGYAADLLKVKPMPARASETQFRPTQQSTSQQPQPAVKVGGGRLKGKARKIAKARGAFGSATKATGSDDSTQPFAPTHTNSSLPRETQADNGPITPTTTYTIGVKDFINLSEFIAAHNEKREIHIPASVASSLKRAIEVRKSYATQLSDVLRQQNREENKGSRKRHNYFVGVLEHVRDVLEPLMPQSFFATSKTDDSETLLNQFENLKMYEPSEQFLNAPDASIPLAADTQPAERYEADTSDLMEACVAFELILTDLTNMRNTIIETWHMYKSRVIDLTSAALTTNTAVDIARRMVEDVIPILEPHGGCEKMMHVIHMCQCVVAGEDPFFIEQPGDYFNIRMYKAAESMFWPTYRLLEGFCAIAFGSRNVLQAKPNHFGVYNPRASRDRMSDRAKANEDRALLMNVLSEFSFLSKFTKPMMWEDEITAGLRETLCNTNKIPLWLTFALQLHMDINHILRAETSRAYDDLVEAATKMKESITMTLKYHESKRPDGWPNDEAFNMVLERIEFVIGPDQLYSVKQKLNLPNGPGLRFEWLKMHPLFAGCYLFHLKCIFQELGLHFANAWGSIMYSGHLYAAIHQFNRGVKWDDMDLVLMLHRDGFFVGEQPKTIDDFLKRYALSMGISASEFARGKRPNQRNKPELSKRGPRTLKPRAPVSFMFRDRYCEQNGRKELSIKELRAILLKGMWEVHEEETKEMNEEATKLGGEGADSCIFAPNEDDPSTTQERLKQCTLPELLAALRNSVMAEFVEFTFDYLTMHKMSWITLATIHKIMRSEFIKNFGPQYIENETQIPIIVGYILTHGAAAERLNKLSGLESNGQCAESNLFQIAEICLQSLLEREDYRRQTTYHLGVEVVLQEEYD